MSRAVKSKRYVLAFAIVSAIIAQVKAQAVFDDQTPCSAAVEAFNSHDEEKMREVAAYIEGVFGQLDQREKDNGEAGILAEPNDREGNILMAVAVGSCQSWTRLSEQFFRFDRWSLCRG
jgi:hypothetical protein